MGLCESTPIVGELEHLIIPSGVARPGMSIYDAVTECVKCNLPGIPFCDAKGNTIGRVSIKNLLVQNCIPRDVILHADLLGDHLHSLAIAQEKITRIMETPVDAYVIPALPSVTRASPLIKALALIDKYNSTYIFVEEDGKYLGTITLMHIIETMLQLYQHPTA